MFPSDDAGRVPPARAIHHVDLWVTDAAVAAGEWGWLFGELGWAGDASGAVWEADDGTYVVVEASPDRSGGHERHRAGVNHVAFTVGDRTLLDRVRAESTAHGWHELFADRYPHAGGEDHPALYLENSEGFEVELVLEVRGTSKL